jgi:hypothetical protein
MIRIALAVVTATGLTFAAEAADISAAEPAGISQIGPLCQTPDGSLIVCHSRHGGDQIGPLCQTPDGSLIVCHSRHGGDQIGPLCQTPDGSLIVCHSRRG